jgi:signal transduction histidine kinase
LQHDLFFECLNSVIAALLTAVVGFYPYFARRNNVTKLFALSNLYLCLWNLADLFILTPFSHSVKLFLYRLSYVSGTLVVWYFFNFILNFAECPRDRYIKAWTVLKYSSILIGILCFTPWIMANIRESNYPFEVPGVLFPAFMVYLIGGLSYPMIRLFQAYRISLGRRREQLMYMMVALFFGLIEGPLYFFDVYTYKMASFFYYSQVIYSLIVAYAILAHQLMDISFIIRKTVIYSMVTGVMTAIIVFFAALIASISHTYWINHALIASALAACLISIVFHPVQLAVQRFVDRHLFRDWADKPVAREIASGFSHELKSPLAGLSMQAQLAMAHVEDLEVGHPRMKVELSKLKDELRYILNQAMDAARRIEAVRGVAEPDRGKLQPIDIPDLINSSLVHLNSVIEHSDVTIQRSLPADLRPVQGDAKQLEIVLLNLLKNAIQAMDGSGNATLTLSGHELDGAVILSIRDTGPGIALKDIPHIFEPYYTTKGHKGTGMGLYLAQQIIKAHGGSIEVASEPGRGTEFKLRLPKYDAAKDAA